jgi:hypothetical protein
LFYFSFQESVLKFFFWGEIPRWRLEGGSRKRDS